MPKIELDGLPVIDAAESETVTVAVSAEDLQAGDMKNPEHHPIAIALRRQRGVDDASTPAPAPDMTSPLVLIAEPKVQPEVPPVVPAPHAARAEAPPHPNPVTGPRDFGLGGM
jgi:hypothetical protein